MKIVKFLVIGGVFLLGTQCTQAQASANQPKPQPPTSTKSAKASGFGDIMLKLGEGLVKEVKRRLNLEEAEIVTITKEAQPNGSIKYRIETPKYTFYVKKKPKK